MLGMCRARTGSALGKLATISPTLSTPLCPCGGIWTAELWNSVHAALYLQGLPWCESQSLFDCSGSGALYCQIWGLKAATLGSEDCAGHVSCAPPPPPCEVYFEGWACGNSMFGVDRGRICSTSSLLGVGWISGEGWGDSCIKSRSYVCAATQIWDFVFGNAASLPALDDGWVHEQLLLLTQVCTFASCARLDVFLCNFLQLPALPFLFMLTFLPRRWCCICRCCGWHLLQQQLLLPLLLLLLLMPLLLLPLLRCYCFFLLLLGCCC